MEKISGKVVAVGDIHGEYDKMRRMLACLVRYEILDDRWLVLLGDYVDMGPDTAKVIEFLVRFKKEYHPNTAFICGNHDLNLIKALGLVDSPEEVFYRGRVPTRNRDVLVSYGARNVDELKAKMPDSHKEFLANLNWAVEHPDYLFVHVGLDPNESYEAQVEALAERDMVPHKPKWLYRDHLSFSSPRTDKIVVSGHMILNDAIGFNNRRLIDTGCGYGGELTALQLPEDQIIQPETDRKFVRSPIPMRGEPAAFTWAQF